VTADKGECIETEELEYLLELSYTNPIFGDWTGIPRADRATFRPTPIGAPCAWCAESIVAGDLGEFLAGSMLVVHRECMMLGIMGHRFGVCDCTDYAGAATLRQAGFELERRVELFNKLAGVKS